MHVLLCIACCVLSIVSCVLSMVLCLVCCVLTVFCSVFSAMCFVFCLVVCCVLCVACCLLSAVCCVLCTYSVLVCRVLRRDGHQKQISLQGGHDEAAQDPGRRAFRWRHRASHGERPFHFLIHPTLHVCFYHKPKRPEFLVR